MADGDKAKLVREHAEKTCKAEMEAVPDDVPYTVVDLVGKGSFGSVFKGIHNETKQVFAIKSLDLEQTDEDIGDIQKEINLLSQLTKGDAPNITAFHGSYVLGHKLWIIMDFCSGGSMRTLMKAGPIEEKYIAIVIRETLMALVYLHAQGIIHRDIKAANILVNADGRVQLCDFGVSAQLANKANKRNTFVGTPQWMAPEALTGGMYDFKIDIWSFGITIIELAKQNPPLYQYHPDRVIDMIPRIPPPRLEGGNWSDALRQFVALCLNEIPDQRPTAEELMKTKYVKSIKTPTSAMRDLCLRHADWERGGGARVSMMMMYPNGRYDDAGNDPVDPEWDFDTVKSRVSGVPKEFEMLNSIQRQASYGSGGTLRGYPPRPTQLGGRGRPRGAEKLFRLFKDPNEADEDEEWDEAGVSTYRPPQNKDKDSGYQQNNYSASGIISIPSFDDDGNMSGPGGTLRSASMGSNLGAFGGGPGDTIGGSTMRNNSTGNSMGGFGGGPGDTIGPNTSRNTFGGGPGDTIGPSISRNTFGGGPGDTIGHNTSRNTFGGGPGDTIGPRSNSMGSSMMGGFGGGPGDTISGKSIMGGFGGGPGDTIGAKSMRNNSMGSNIMGYGGGPGGTIGGSTMRNNSMNSMSSSYGGGPGGMISIPSFDDDGNILSTGGTITASSRNNSMSSSIHNNMGGIGNFQPSSSYGGGQGGDFSGSGIGIISIPSFDDDGNIVSGGTQNARTSRNNSMTSNMAPSIHSAHSNNNNLATSRNNSRNNSMTNLSINNLPVNNSRNNSMNSMTNPGGLGPGIGPSGPGSRSASQTRPVPAPIHPPPVGMISIPSFDDDGNILIDSPVTARPIPRPDFPRSVSPSHGIISMPTEEEMMAMALAKAAARPASPNPGATSSIGASIPRSLTPGPLTAIPPSTPLPVTGLENPTITRTRAGNMTGSPDSFTSPASARSVSPNRPPVASSAPSSPPRTGLLGMNKPHHLSSKSVPTFAGSGSAGREREREEAPPIPGIVKSGDSNGPPGEAIATIAGQAQAQGQTPQRLNSQNGPADPHQKARSQDITRNRTGKMVARPSHLNLSSAGSGAFIDSTRLGSPRGIPIPISYSQGQAVTTNGNTVAAPHPQPQMPQAMNHMARNNNSNNGVKQILAEFTFPQLAPLDTAMLAAASGEELAREMERIMAGLGDALEVMEVGLRMLSQERQGRGDGEEEEEG